MTYFLKNGSTFRVATKESMDLHEKLPGGNFVVKFNPMSGFYLEQIEDFTEPKKIYGTSTRDADRIISTFKARSGSTGVMLVGEKGSGKTLLSKSISLKLAKEDVPTIVVNAAFKGDDFNTLLQSIDQPCVILFDEFEKVYDRDDQEAILTLLDGIFSSKKLFIMTSNDKWRVDFHMRNRPGRIFYLLDFKGLSPEFVAEYCQDNLKNLDYVEKVVMVSGLFGEFNFDMLKALVEEMNRYDESPQQALRMLNVKPEFDNGGKYEIKMIANGQEISSDRLSDNIYEGNPLTNKGFNIWIENPEVDEGLDDDAVDALGQERNYSFNSGDLVSVNAKVGEYIFETNGVKFVLTRVKEKAAYDWRAF